MINLNDYINKTVEVQLGEAILHVKMPSFNQMSKIAAIEAAIGKDEAELYESKPKIALILINNNMENMVFEQDYIDRIPLKGLLTIINAAMSAKIEVENDPNSDSQSPAAK